MKRFLRNTALTGLSALMLLGTFACDRGNPPAVDSGETDTVEEDWIDIGEDTVTFEGVLFGEGGQPLAPTTPKPGESTPRPTPDPAATPEPSRAPEEGDVTTERYPAKDTGWSADWSYQSDELRVAVTRYEDSEDRIVFYVADIWMRNINCFRTEFSNGKYQAPREDPEDFANRINAVFGISGTMNAGLVVHNGKKYKNQVAADIPFRAGILTVYRDGSVKMFNLRRNQNFNLAKEDKKNGGVLHALQFGPVLVQDGKIQSGLKTKERHPRIVFGYCEPGHYIAVAVDGRTKTSIGMTEQELAELMLSLGCTDAINLDGGNSAVMLFMGKTINVPSGQDKDGDGVAGRNILDLLAFAEYDENGTAPDLSTLHPDHMPQN